jgi:Zn-dependent protease
MFGMEMTELISRLVIFIVVLLLSISIHEAGHAWMSWKFGDDTAYNLGRVTLNPIAHTDPIGTLLLPILGFLSASMGGLALLGWGKPCPVNPRNWANYKTANFWVSIAGVLGNLILVIVAFAIIKVVVSLGYYQAEEFVFRTQDAIVMFVQSLLLMNVSLIVFNLLPFPPLDGSKILSNFLPPSFQPVFDMLDQYGVIFLWILVISGVTGYIFRPVFELVKYLVMLTN